MFEILEFEWRPRGAFRMPRTPRLRPRRPPQPRPVFGLWPYRVPVIETLPWPEEEPDEELPAKLSDGVQRMPPSLQPVFDFIGTLENAATHEKAKGPGLYYFEFVAMRRRRAYSGESGNLAKRLKQHRQRAIMMGLNPRFIKVYASDGPKDQETRRKQEKALHKVMFEHHKGFLTNQNLEMEFACGCPRCKASLAALRAHAPG
ncbi:hypothetical protein [Massilia endophytica]|uniref:hypothetical protein n=1 Tax=Massilia endophytica TaxID=2899220 RepID=UPI001E483D83|nr:hypothetical protein [Massilia endophytica]UGQ48442.1 hypothetical protein LSQ66_08225 [Massilia endophytica]